MRRLILRISDFDFERIRFEALLEKKSIREILMKRIFSNPFCEEVEEALDSLIQENFHKLCQEPSETEKWTKYR